MHYKIELNNLRFYGFHGVNPKEAKTGNFFRVDVIVTVKTGNEIHSDNLKDALNYEEIYNVIQGEMKRRSNLLENLCYRIAKAIYSLNSERIKKVYVRVEKSYFDGMSIGGSPAVSLTYPDD